MNEATVANASSVRTRADVAGRVGLQIGNFGHERVAAARDGQAAETSDGGNGGGAMLNGREISWESFQCLSRRGRRKAGF